MNAPARPDPASYLFVPASRPERIAKALASGADAVIVDLEDGVAADTKDTARAALLGLTDLVVPRPVHLRINGPGTAWHDDDLRVAAELSWVDAVIVPKVESIDDIAGVAAAVPGLAVVALVETALGFVHLDHLATAAPLARLMFGSADYLADIGAAPSPEVLAYPRSRLVVASRAAGLPAPVDGPTLAIDDEPAIRADAAAARALGLGAKLCIHPAQVSIVNDVFRSSDRDRRWARAVLDAAAAHGGGAFSFEGSMVDEPVLARARQILDVAAHP